MGKVIAKIDEVFLETSSEKKHQIPLDVFPLEIQSIVYDYNKYLNYPIEFTIASIMGAISVTLGNNVELEVKKGWNDRALLYMMLVGDRGYGKSHPMNTMFKPIFEREKQWNEEYVSELKEYQEKLKAKEDLDLQLPIKKRITVSRFSSEILYKITSDNPKGIIVHCDEAKEWFGTFNQYAKNADENTWAKIYNGIHFDRDTYTHGHQYVPKVFVSILGGIQPPELYKFIRDNTDNGLIDRILFYYPTYLKMEYLSDNEISDTTIQSWYAIYNRLFDYFEDKELITLRYSEKAWQKYKSWDKKIVDEANADASNGIFRGIVSKARTNVHRIALLLEAIKWACSDQSFLGNISESSASGAIRLTEYFIDEVLKLRQDIQTIKPADNKELLFDLMNDEFTTDEALKMARKHKICERRNLYNLLKNDSRYESLGKGTGKYRKVVKDGS